jgi:sugar phosphate isomerase/epimerase
MVMAITEVVVNYETRNYFDDYNEIRSDHMTWVKPEKVLRAIDKLVRRYRNHQTCDCMFVKNDDDTGWRLMYGYDERRFDPKTSKRTLRLRHYTVYSIEGWDTEETVSVARAKECILGGEQ